MPAAGHLTTHVLDVARGRPAEGVEIALHALDADGRTPVATGRTDADGRTPQPLVQAGGLRAGEYELTFSVGAHLASEGGFFEDIPVRFVVADPEQDHHVPLLLSPWSYTVYRGS